MCSFIQSKVRNISWSTFQLIKVSKYCQKKLIVERLSTFEQAEGSMSWIRPLSELLEKVIYQINWQQCMENKNWFWKFCSWAVISSWYCDNVFILFFPLSSYHFLYALLYNIPNYNCSQILKDGNLQIKSLEVLPSNWRMPFQ